MSNKDHKESKPSLYEQLLSSSWMQQLIEKKKIVAYYAGAVVLLLILIAFVLQRSQKKTATEYTTAVTYMESLEQPNSADQDDSEEHTKTKNPLQALDALANSNTQVKKRCSGILAEEYLLKNQVAVAAPFANYACKQLQSLGAHSFASFSSLALLISQDKQKEALARVKKLREQLQEQLNDREENPHLIAFALLQEAALEKACGNDEAARQRYNELQKITDVEFSAHLQDKNKSITDFYLK